MNRARLGIVSALLSTAVFYVIYAVLCAFIPTGNGEAASVLRPIAEACASFGGICSLKLIADRFFPRGEESEIADADGERVTEAPQRQKTVLRGVLTAILCAAVLFGANLLYSTYVYGSGDAPKLSLPVSIIVLGILVPISEEIFFRGHLIPRMTEVGVPRGVAVFTAAVMFALIHDYRVMPFALFAGICLGFCSLTGGKRGYLISFAAHGIYNSALCVIYECIMQNA